MGSLSPEPCSSNDVQPSETGPPDEASKAVSLDFSVYETNDLIKNCLISLNGDKINFESVSKNLIAASSVRSPQRATSFFSPERCENEFNLLYNMFKKDYPDICASCTTMNRTIHEIQIYREKKPCEENKEFCEFMGFIRDWQFNILPKKKAERRKCLQGLSKAYNIDSEELFKQPKQKYNSLVREIQEYAQDTQFQYIQEIKNAKALAETEKPLPENYKRPAIPKFSCVNQVVRTVPSKETDSINPCIRIETPAPVISVPEVTVKQKTVTPQPIELVIKTEEPTPEVIDEIPEQKPDMDDIPVVAEEPLTKTVSAPKIESPECLSLKDVVPTKPAYPLLAPLEASQPLPVSLPATCVPVAKSQPSKKKMPQSISSDKILSETEAMPPPPLPHVRSSVELDNSAAMPPPPPTTRARPRTNRATTTKRTVIKRTTDDPELTSKIAKIVADAAALQSALETAPLEASSSRNRNVPKQKPVEAAPSTSTPLPPRMRRKPATIYSPSASPVRPNVEVIPLEEGASSSRKVATARRKVSKVDRTTEAPSRASSTATLKKRMAAVPSPTYRRFATQSMLSFPNRLGIQRRRLKRTLGVFRGVKEEEKAVSRACGTQTTKKIRATKVRFIRTTKFPKNLQDFLNKSKKNTLDTPNTIPVEVYADDSKIPNIWSCVEKHPFGQVIKKACNAADPTGFYHNPVSHFPHYYQACKYPFFTDSINKKIADNQMSKHLDLQLHMALMAANCRVAAKTPDQKTKANELGTKMLRSLDRQVWGPSPTLPTTKPDPKSH